MSPRRGALFVVVALAAIAHCTPFGSDGSGGSESPPPAPPGDPRDGSATDATGGQDANPPPGDAAAQPDSPLDAPLEVGTGGGDAGCVAASGTKKYVFYISPQVVTSLGIIDDVCNVQGKALVPSGATFVAWLSTPTSDAISRLSEGYYVNANGEVVFPSRAAVASGALCADILRPDKSPVTAMSSVWTGTLADGGRAQDTCGGWADASAGLSAEVGRTGARDSWWTAYAELGCNSNAWVICFQQ